TAAGTGNDVAITNSADITATLVSGRNVTLTASTGDVNLTSVTADNLATITATTGNIVNAGTGPVLQSGTASLTAGEAIGAVDTPLLTQVSSLSAQANNGGVFITNSGAGALTLTSVTGNGSINLENINGDLTVGTNVQSGIGQ